MQPCARCGEAAVTLVQYSGEHLCSDHLQRFVEKRVKREVREQLTIPPDGVTVAVGVSGGKDSLVTLTLLQRIFEHDPRVRLHALSVDEGIDGYRSESLELAQATCEELGVPMHVTHFEEMTGLPQDDLVTLDTSGRTPCSVCGVLRRRGLNALAREVDADVLATGHNLDDTAQSILMNLLRGDVERLARLAPHTRTIEGLVPRIQPLRSVPEREVALYAHLQGLEVHVDECPHSTQASRRFHRDLLHDLEDRTPGTRHRLVAAGDRIRDVLREALPEADLDACPNCGEPTSGGVCRACTLLADLRERAQEAGHTVPVDGPAAGVPEEVTEGSG